MLYYLEVVQLTKIFDQSGIFLKILGGDWQEEYLFVGKLLLMANVL